MSTFLTQLSDGLSEIVSAATPSVVRIEGARRSPATGFAWSDDLVVTAAHAIRRREGIRVAFDDTSLAASVVGGDHATDIALLRVDRKALQPIRWSDRDPKPGNIVLAAGRPGRSVHASFGIVSAPAAKYIDVDGFLPRGFSGGPLLSTDGAIGMNTSALTPGGTTIPRATLQRVVDAIVQHGRVQRPVIGVGVYPVEGGLLVMSSEREEILVGDILRKVAAKDVRSPRDLAGVVAELEIGKTIDIELRRGGEQRTLRIEVRSR